LRKHGLGAALPSDVRLEEKDIRLLKPHGETMARWKAALAAGTLLIVLVYSAPLMGQESKGPKIEFKGVRHDFGKVVKGTRVTHVFEVRNAGNEPLIIERLEPS
jgi:hypothetical protein